MLSIRARTDNFANKLNLLHSKATFWQIVSAKLAQGTHTKIPAAISSMSAKNVGYANLAS
jgi:hypothetical protein